MKIRLARLAVVLPAAAFLVGSSSRHAELNQMYARLDASTGKTTYDEALV